MGIYANQLNNTEITENGITYDSEEFEFILIDGNTKNLSDYRGKIVILDMWATWCGPCTYQMDELKKTYDYYDRNDLEIISLNIDPRESSQVIYDYIEDFKNQYGIELDWIFGQDDGTVWEKYMINGGIPTLYIFDKHGQIHFRHEGVSVFSEIPAGWPEDTETLSLKIEEII